MNQTEILQWIQSFESGWLDQVMIFFSWFGNEEFYMAALPILYLAVSKKIGIRLSLIVALSGFVNAALKFMFATTRPIGVEGIRNLYVESAPGNSFPSGHAQGVTTFWGYLASQARRRWFTGIVVVLILGVLLSRLYLGVHWPIDVLGGFVIGMAFVVLINMIDQYFTRRPLPFAWKLALGVLFPLLLLLWYNEPDGRKFAGFLMGAWLGYVIESTVVGMELPREWWKRATVTVATLAIVFLMRAGLKAVLPEAFWADVTRYAAMGVVVTLIVPYVLVKIGWYRPGVQNQ